MHYFLYAIESWQGGVFLCKGTAAGNGVKWRCAFRLRLQP